MALNILRLLRRSRFLSVPRRVEWYPPFWLMGVKAIELDSDLELRFDFDPPLRECIRQELEVRGRSTPEFKYGLYREDGRRCTRIHCRVTIRPRGYSKRA